MITGKQKLKLRQRYVFTSKYVKNASLGLAPKIRVREFHFKTRTERVRNVSLELNHRHWPQRDGKHVIFHTLEKVTPEHTLRIPRYPGSELLEILQGIETIRILK